MSDKIDDTNRATETAHWNQQWAASIIKACLASGSDHFFVAPGSRCAPLTLAIAQRPDAHVMQHFDERGLAFACLGYAQATGRAGLFVCTSGTAAANAFPAVIEASARHVPMLLLTADRPSELHGSGANQTIDQQHLYGRYARWFHNLPCADDARDPRQAIDAIRSALNPCPTGPVQVNCMFREPLVPNQLDSRSFDDLAIDLPAAEPETLPPAPSTIPPPVTERAAPPHRVRGGNTLILLGDCTINEAAAGERLARRWGCPLLADVTSSLRTSAYDLALASGALPSPETLVHLGGHVVSKRLLQWLAKHPPRQWIHVWPHTQRYDPVQCVTDSIVTPIAAWADSAELQNRVPATFFDAWQRGQRVARQVAIELARGITLTEPAIASALAQQLPNHHGLWLGNSMPVREMDTFGFWEPRHQLSVGANRGASGIDGQVSTAAGFAWGLENATTILLGDLSLLHDLNALALFRKSKVPLILIVINNNGGGIFHFLPIARQTPHFEQYFGTPHGFHFQNAAAMFAIPYETPRTVGQLCEVHRKYLDAGQSVLIEVTTDRAANVAVHREIEQRLRTAIEKQLS